jgi:PqqD family protein of HPr-rel-A system
MDRYGRADGVLVEPVGHLWAAFSPLSGETTLLNDESAAILEVLESGGNDTWGVCTALAEDGGLDAQQFVAAVAGGWARLLDAGLVTRLPDVAAADS